MNDFYGEVFFCTSAATVDCCRLIPRRAQAHEMCCALDQCPVQVSCKRSDRRGSEPRRDRERKMERKREMD